MKEFKVPVLPIANTVLFARTSLPILILDPLFSRMIYDCIENSMPLAISYIRPQMLMGRANIPYTYRPMKICGIGNPIILKRENNQGGLHVLLKGIARVELKEAIQHIPYPIYHASELPDFYEDTSLSSAPIVSLQDLLISWLETFITNSVEKEEFIKGIKRPEDIIDYLSLLLIREGDIKQILLECRSLHERILILHSLFKDIETNSPSNKFNPNPMVKEGLKQFEIIEYTGVLAS